MTGFFRHLKKGILILIGLIIVVSMAFSGLNSTIARSKKKEAIYRSQGVDGRSIKESELKAIALFLQGDATSPDNKGEPLFLLKSNWFVRNLLEPSVIQEIVKNYAPLLQSSLQEKMKEHRKQKMYSHPSDPSICLEKSVAQFFPDFSQCYEDFMKGDSKNFDKDFESLVSLYRIASKVPMNWMKQILYYEQMQKRGQIEVDKSLEHRDISLFKAQKLSDWFGTQTIDLLSQWVYNTAVFARGYESYRGFQGYRVSLGEAESSLRTLIKKNLKRSSSEENSDVSPDEMMQRLAHNHGLYKEELVSGWQKVMLFRRLFHDVGNVAVKDDIFKHLIKESKVANLKTLELDDALKSDSFYHVAKLDTYLNELSLNPSQKFEKFSFHDLEDLQKMNSFLVARPFKIKYAKTTLKEAADEIGLTELYEFELSDKGFKFLQAKSANLRSLDLREMQERKTALEALDANEKNRLETLCRLEIVKDRQPIIRDLLVDQKMQELVYFQTNQKSLNVLDAIFDTKALSKDLEDSLKDEKMRQELFCYSQDNETFFRFEIVEIGKDQILTFDKANEIGLMNAVVDKDLRKEYSRLKEIDPALKNEDSSFKTYLECKDVVAASSYRQLKDAINKKLKLKGISSDKDSGLELIATHYFDDLIEHAFKRYEQTKFEPTSNDDPLIEQFALRSTSKVVHENNNSLNKELFNADNKDFRMGFDDFAYIYKVESVVQDTKRFVAARKKAQNMLSNEAKMNAALKVLDKMKSLKIEIYDQGQ